MTDLQPPPLVQDTTSPTSQKALVLGGGSLKGAFQAGAVVALFEHGFVPNAIYGISVGALNATFLAHEATRQQAETGQINWPLVGRALISFWLTNITCPQDVAAVRPYWRTSYNTLLSRFDGLLDNAPIKNLMRNTIDVAALRNGPVTLKVGAVNINEGEMEYADAHHENFLDFVFASSALPLLMPAVAIGGDHRRAFLDGGIREVAPLREALADGMTDIACVACHARRIANEKFNYRNLLNLMDRVKDITVNQLVNNDIAWAEGYVEQQRLRGQDMRFSVIRPVEPLCLNLQKFSSEDISQIIVQGYKDAIETLRAEAIIARKTT